MTQSTKVILTDHLVNHQNDMLLLWAQSISPSPGSRLVTIRFSSVVQVESIRIVPRGIAPFAKEPLLLGETTPGSFDLKLYLNCQVTSDSKAKANNSLVATTINYHGEMVDHELHMGHQFSTRLMIVEGDFERLSIAVYGELSDPQLALAGSEELMYAPVPLPIPSISKLPTPLDVAESQEPCLLAQRLLSSAKKTQSLEAVAQAIFFPTQTNDENGVALEDMPEVMARSTFPPLTPNRNASPDTQDGSDEKWIFDASKALLKQLDLPDFVSKDPTKTSKMFLGVSTLALVMVWVYWEEPMTTQGGLLERCLQITRLWINDPPYRQVTLAILSSKTVFPTIASLYNQPSTTQIATLAHQIISAVLADPLSVIQPAVSEALSAIDSTQLVASDETIRLASGDMAAVMEWIVNCAKTLEITYTEAISLRVALQKLQTFLRKDENGEWTLLKTVWAEEEHGLAYSLLDILQHTANAVSRGIGADGITISTNSFLELLMNIISCLLELIIPLSPLIPTTSRVATQLTGTVVSIYLATANILNNVDPTSSFYLTTKEARELSTQAFLALDSIVRRSAGTELGKALLMTLLSPVQTPGSFLVSRAPQVHCLLLLHLPSIATADTRLRDMYLRNIIALLPQFWEFLELLEGDLKATLLLRIVSLDGGRANICQWAVLQELRSLESSLSQLVTSKSIQESGVQVPLLQHHVASILRFICHLIVDESYASAYIVRYLTEDDSAVEKLESCFALMTQGGFITDEATQIAYVLSARVSSERSPELSLALLIILLQSSRLRTRPLLLTHILSSTSSLLERIFALSAPIHAELDVLFNELGGTLMQVSRQPIRHAENPELIGKALLFILELTKRQQDRVGWNRVASKMDEEEYADYDDGISSHDAETNGPMSIPGVTEDVFHKLVEDLDRYTTSGSRSIASFQNDIAWSDHRLTSLTVFSASSSIPITANDLRSAFDANELQGYTSTPPTPPTILGLVSLSPFTALRSPNTRVSTLTKTYTNNDFRQLRTSPHMNTSRPPSMHVDDFVLSTSPTTPAHPLPMPLLPSQMPNW